MRHKQGKLETKEGQGFQVRKTIQKRQMIFVLSPEPYPLKCFCESNSIVTSKTVVCTLREISSLQDWDLKVLELCIGLCEYVSSTLCWNISLDPPKNTMSICLVWNDSRHSTSDTASYNWV